MEEIREKWRYAFEDASRGEPVISLNTMSCILNRLGVTKAQFSNCQKLFGTNSKYRPEDVFGMLMFSNEYSFMHCVDWSELVRLRSLRDFKELSNQATHRAAQFCGISKCMRCWRYIPYEATQCCCTQRNNESLFSRLTTGISSVPPEPAPRLCDERNSTSSAFGPTWDYLLTVCAPCSSNAGARLAFSPRAWASVTVHSNF
jgi:hypothetical protein